MATLTVASTKNPDTILDQVIVDLKSKLYSPTNDRSLYISNFANEVATSQLHSNQMNTSSLLKYFEIVNQTSVSLVSAPSRQSICSDVKLCDKKPENSQICLLNINMILYMVTREIKLVNLGIILNDLSDDKLNFDQLKYDFDVDPSVSIDIGSREFPPMG